MSKKIIALLSVATLVFVCVFAACGKDDGLYIDDKEYDFVTDENGEKVLDDDGMLLVYGTDEDGETVTEAKQFQPIENDGVVEDYGYILTLPEGWETTDEYGKFVNPDSGIECSVTVVKYFYEDYYNINKGIYEDLSDEDDVECAWEEDLGFDEEFEGACRFTLISGDYKTLIYFFNNSGNVYKLRFSGANEAVDTKSTDEFCKSMKLKPYSYYNDITERSTSESE